MREYEKGGSRGSRRGSLKAGSGSGRFSRKTDRRTAPSWRGLTGSLGGRDPARGRREKPMAGSALLSLFPWNCEKGSTFLAACDRIILISSIGGFPALAIFHHHLPPAVRPTRRLSLPFRSRGALLCRPRPMTFVTQIRRPTPPLYPINQKRRHAVLGVAPRVCQYACRLKISLRRIKPSADPPDGRQWHPGNRRYPPGFYPAVRTGRPGPWS